MNSRRFLCFIVLVSHFFVQCRGKQDSLTQFSLVSATESGISFSNTLVASAEFNILEYLYFYNGGGVACGDINNDGLVDIYFSSNQNSNRLYLNKGNFKFEDITEKSGTAGIGNWKTGVTMADVNGDGYVDIYVCGVGNYKKFDSQNQLLINNGDLTFSDKTEEFGLQFKGFSTQTIFFDYDQDGDLDCYLLNHSVHSASSYVSVANRIKNDSASGDQFFRNDLIRVGGRSGGAGFVNITKESGILSSRLGYGLGVGVSDLNLDGFPDIYVSNDFQENDYLYLNNQKGGFRQVLEKSMAHSSRFSMGNDIADVNNDGRPDIMTTDMLPQDEAIIKTSAGEDSYEVNQFKLKFGYHYQVARNSLQLNRLITDSLLVFTDIAPLAGVEATDWSWSPLLADFDNDGLKDLFISNGIVRRPNDLDYINFISNSAVQDSLRTIEYSDLQILKAMPEGKVSNFFFRNLDGIHFENVSKKWGVEVPSFSNGSSYADLDNDGDLDLVINNIGEPAFLLRNNSTARSVSVTLKGNQGNTQGIGARVIAFINEKAQYFQVSTTRGFSSASDTRVIIGLGNNQKIDSILVVWSNSDVQELKSVNAGESIEVEQSRTHVNNRLPVLSKPTMFDPLPLSLTPNFSHLEDSYNAFNNEGLIPHMLTTMGPPMVQGDLNNDGLNDLFIGGGRVKRVQFLFRAGMAAGKPNKIDFF